MSLQCNGCAVKLARPWGGVRFSQVSRSSRKFDICTELSKDWLGGESERTLSQIMYQVYHPECVNLACQDIPAWSDILGENGEDQHRDGRDTVLCQCKNVWWRLTVLQKYPIDLRWQVISLQDMNKEAGEDGHENQYRKSVWTFIHPSFGLANFPVLISYQILHLNISKAVCSWTECSYFRCLSGFFLLLACKDEWIIYDAQRDCSYRRVTLHPWVPQLCICPRKKLGRSISCLFACSWHLGRRCSSDDDRWQKQRSSAFTESAMY